MKILHIFIYLPSTKFTLPPFLPSPSFSEGDLAPLFAVKAEGPHLMHVLGLPTSYNR